MEVLRIKPDGYLSTEPLLGTVLSALLVPTLESVTLLTTH